VNRNPYCVETYGELKNRVLVVGQPFVLRLLKGIDPTVHKHSLGACHHAPGGNFQQRSEASATGVVR
jgi:hypothetical protein